MSKSLRNGDDITDDEYDDTEQAPQTQPIAPETTTDSTSAVETPPGKIILEGLRYEKQSETEMHISLRLRRGGAIETEVFHMKRVPY